MTQTATASVGTTAPLHSLGPLDRARSNLDDAS